MTVSLPYRVLSVLILQLAVACVVGCLQPQIAETGTTYARDVVSKYVDSGELPGAVSVFYSDGAQETCVIGYADVGARRPMSIDSALMQGSQTKGFCGVTVAMLIEEGKLGLDDPVSKYLPEFGTLWVEHSNTNGTRVLVKAQNVLTVRQVMNHTGGFRFELPSFQTLGGWSRRMPLRSVAAMAAALPLLFEPGTSVQYSNLGIDIGGAIVEVVAGERWENFLQRRVLDPLEMKDTGFCPTDEQLVNRMSMYDVAGGTVAKWKLAHPSMQGPYNDDRVFPSAGAGLWTTPRDQLKFYKMLMNLGVGENGVRILKEDTVKTLLARSTRSKGMGGYSLGLFAPEEDTEDAWFGHDGAWGTDGKVNWHKKQLRLWAVQIWGKPRPWDDDMKAAANDFFGSVHSGLDAGAGSDNAK